ncbi:MAG: Rrf2 family transcriptional regulator [Bacillota bacterium]
MEIIKRNTDYALRSLVRLAQAAPGKPVSVSYLADAEGIPLNFLQKIFRKFAEAGIVCSQRGAQGGYLLAKEPEDISILDIVEVMQGRPAINQCYEQEEKCDRVEVCALKDAWRPLQESIIGTLAALKLADLVRKA